MKSYYSDYVAHMVRLWIKLNGNPDAVEALDSVARLNYDIVNKIFNDMESHTKLILVEIYSSININDAIKRLSESANTKDTPIWAKVKVFEKEVARQRGLIA